VRLLTALKFGLSMDKALQLAAAGQQSHALVVLDSFEPRLAEGLEVQILRLSLLWQLKRFEEVLESSDAVLSRIPGAKRLRPAEKRYLQAFVQITKDTAQAARRGLPHDIFDMDKFNWGEIELDKVSKP
jgi:hypothetical protein